MNNQSMPPMPEVRSIPTWAPDAVISVTGTEWEAIQNGLTNIQYAQQAAQSVMSRAIVAGTIKMEFEKLNAKTLEYETMTDEEKAPHVEQLNKAIEAIRKGEIPVPGVEVEKEKATETNSDNVVEFKPSTTE